MRNPQILQFLFRTFTKYQDPLVFKNNTAPFRQQLTRRKLKGNYNDMLQSPKSQFKKNGQLQNIVNTNVVECKDLKIILVFYVAPQKL